jgi:hypothetical protein
MQSGASQDRYIAAVNPSGAETARLGESEELGNWIGEVGIGGTLSAAKMTVALTTSGAGKIEKIALGGRLIFEPQAVPITAAGDAIPALASFVEVANASGTITLTSTPTIAAGAAGQVLVVLSTGAGSVGLQDNATLSGSNLLLGATARTLGTRDSLVLIYSQTLGRWVELAYANC